MEIISRTFDKLLKSRTVDEVDRILDDCEIHKKYRMDDTVYPQLKLTITKEEIDKLKSEQLISDENLIMDVSTADALTKLLYAVLWKNGDLNKIKHIIDGIISGHSTEKENGLVFYHFGKYLTKKFGEPIIDQHVLRAFGIFKANGDTEKIEKIKRLSLITKNEIGLIEQYKHWLRTDLTKELRDNDQYPYHVDKVLFAVGKSVKARS